MTYTSVGLSGPAALRETILSLVTQFHRFGLSGSAPDLIAAGGDAPPERVGAARGRLIHLLETDARLEKLEQLGTSELEGLLLEMLRLCVEGRLQPFLAEAGVPYPVYNFFAGFAENLLGPWDTAPDLPAVPSRMGWELMGIPVRMPIGVPASGLTANSRWVRYFARRGFNILTYKTVRSMRTAAHRYPHWVFIEDADQWANLDEVGPVRGDLTTWPKDMLRFSTANSFGPPSPDPDEWGADVGLALQQLLPGQLLIVSVMGTAEKYEGTALVEDFVRVALMAENAGALAIELNLSCPNAVRNDGSGMSLPICYDAETTRRVVSEVRSALRDKTKLVAKLSCLPPDDLAAVVGAIGALVDGLSGINTVQAPIFRTDVDETPFVGTALDPSQPRAAAGVSGSRIQALGLDFVSRASILRQESGLKFQIIGMGGVIDSADVEAYTTRGADAVQTATGACIYPDLPVVLARAPDLFGRSAKAPSPRESGLRRVGRVLSTGGLSLVLDRSSSSR